jgi:2OG-Fe(II) oxygenase superfamily
LTEAPVAAGAGLRLRSASPEALQELRGEFGRQHFVRLTQFFDRQLLDWVDSQVEEADFEVRTSENVGSEWLMKPNAVAATLNWLLNAPELIQAVRGLTGCEDVNLFLGRVYRIDPSSGQSFAWHDDRQFEERRLAISVNLGARPHDGGVLRIRPKDTPEAIAEAPNRGHGDAILFRVADELEHCVTPVVGTVPRIAFSGWFRAGPDYYSALVDELGRTRPKRVVEPSA